MTDLIKHILDNNAAVTAIVPTARITSNEREQGAALPAIMIDWVSTNDGYALGQSDGTSEYTFDIIGYTKTMGQAAALMTAIKEAVDRYAGSFTASTGNFHHVIACEILDRNIEKTTGLDALEITVSISLTTNNTAS